MKHTKKSPCSECPFRKKSLPGWLGPDTAQAVISRVHGETGYSCHMDLENAPAIESGEFAGYLDTSNVEHCAGAVIHANLSCKSYRNPELRAQQDLLKGSKHEADVLNLKEFTEHHKIIPGSKRKKG